MNFFYKKQNSEIIYEEKTIGSGFIKILYSKKIVYPLLKLITCNQFVSYLYGKLMNTSYSKRFISKFVNKHDINLDECKKNLSDFIHFNDFFYRELKPQSRDIDINPDSIISPADGKILVYENMDTISVKGSMFNIDKLLNNKELSMKYKSCSIAVIRLAPTDYHRFHFPCNGYVSETTMINGRYFSVAPIALHFNPKIFIENKRTLCEIKNEKIGDLLYLEIGATMVGSIKQTYKPNTQIKKGDEKGYFEFGGSTVILIFKQGNIIFNKELIENTNNNYETKVNMGERIALIKL